MVFLAIDFNNPLKAVHSTKSSGPLKELKNSFIQLNSKNIIISALKKCEFDESLIIRMHNTSKETVNETIKCKFPIENIKQVKLDELTEDNSNDIELINNQIQVKNIRPFQLVTMKLNLQ